MSQVALFFLYPQPGGGTTSFTVHLYEGFKRLGIEPKLYRIKPRGEEFERTFSKYDGVKYQNITFEQAQTIVKHTPSLLTAPCHSKHMPWAPNAIQDLMFRGMRVVVHDPNEFKVYDHLNDVEGKRRPFFCIRPTMKKFFKDAIFIPHPYHRHYDGNPYKERPWPWGSRPWHAVSIARVTFVKRTELILRANKKLPKKRQVVIRGSENRLYTRHKLLKEFPDYVQGQTGFPMGWGTSAQECVKARFAVDFTWFPDDGGGSQYSFMEAWDAGTVNIIHEDWLRYRGEMKAGSNCLAVNGVEQLVWLLNDYDPEHSLKIVENGFKSLKSHDAKAVAKKYWDKLNNT